MTATCHLSIPAGSSWQSKAPRNMDPQKAAERRPRSAAAEEGAAGTARQPHSPWTRAGSLGSEAFSLWRLSRRQSVHVSAPGPQRPGGPGREVPACSLVALPPRSQLALLSSALHPSGLPPSQSLPHIQETRRGRNTRRQRNMSHIHAACLGSATGCWPAPRLVSVEQHLAGGPAVRITGSQVKSPLVQLPGAET